MEGPNASRVLGSVRAQRGIGCLPLGTCGPPAGTCLKERAGPDFKDSRQLRDNLNAGIRGATLDPPLVT